MAVAVLQHTDDCAEPVLACVRWPGFDGSVWHADRPIADRLPSRLLFWHPQMASLPDFPRAGSCPLFSTRLIQAIWGDELGPSERFEAVVADGPEPERQRTDYAAIHVLPVQAATIVNPDRTAAEPFLPGSPIWSSISRLDFHTHCLPEAPVFRIAPYRSALFIHGTALDRLRALNPVGVKLVPLENFQVD